MQDPTAAARRYLDHLTVERGLADNTLAAYRRDLERYLAFLHDRDVDDLNGVDPRLIRAFVASISASTHGPDEEAYKATSVARTLSAVRTFHRFALREGLTEDDPTAGVVRPRLPRGLPHPLTVGEVAAVIDAPAPGSPTGVRDRAILELLYGAGLRVSELTDSTSMTSTSRKARSVCSGRGARSATCRSASHGAGRHRRVSADRASSTRRHGPRALFLNTRGGRLTHHACARLLAEHARAAGVRRTAQPHDLRHSFATHSPRGEPTCGLSRRSRARDVAPRPGYAATTEHLRATYDMAHPPGSPGPISTRRRIHDSNPRTATRGKKNEAQEH